MAEHTTADALNRAAEIIEARGLCRGAAEGPDGSVCTIAALDFAVDELHSQHLYLPATKALRPLIDCESIVEWSDMKALDAADVANHLRKAAERWSERA